MAIDPDQLDDDLLEDRFYKKLLRLGKQAGADVRNPTRKLLEALDRARQMQADREAEPTPDESTET